MESKICGISDSKTLKYLTEHPNAPQYIGFIVNYQKSKRFVEHNQLKKLLKIDKNDSKYVAVLVKPNQNILEEIKDLPFDYYQVYDCTPAEVKSIIEKYNRKVIVAITVKDQNDIVKYLDYNDQYASDAFVQTSIDNGSTWQNVGSEILTSSNWSSQSVDLSSVLGQSNVLISFHYNDLGNWAYAMALDNISVTTLGEATVQTEVNTSTNTNLFLLNGQGTMYAYDSITGGIMSSLTNNNNNDNYECSSVQVSTSGTGGMFFNGSSGSDLAMEKTYNIGVTTDNANGDVTVTFYFTEAEIAGWENAVSAAGGSYTRDLLYLNRKPRNGLQEIVPTTVGSYNGEVTLTANLTSLNGDYTFAPLKVLSSGDDNLINFSVYPNPTQDIINIQSLLDFDSVELYSITGKKINTIKNNDNMRSMQIDMSSLNIGIYFIKIQQSNNNLTSVLKIIKN